MGAFDVIYMHGSTAPLGTPEAYGILDVKAELAYNGATGLDLSTPVIGNAANRAIRAFQSGHALVVDGAVGPLTAAVLYRKRVDALERQYQITDNIACRLVRLESAYDPAAVGVADPADIGIVQIHMPAHPTITFAEAFNAGWSLNYLCGALRNAYLRFGDWDVVIASWNVGGGGAEAWQLAGKPASLFESWYLDPSGNPIDLGARATDYVQLVHHQDCA